MSEKQLFIDGWRFKKTELGQIPEDICSAEDWSPVELPHDWLISHAGNLYEDSEGWYSRELNYDPSCERVLSIRFDGVYMDSTLFVNGVEAGSHRYGYTTFEYELSGFLKAGKNLLLLRVRHKAPNSRWYSGAGIYRNVYLRYSEKAHFRPDGIYISAGKEVDNRWRVKIAADVSGCSQHGIRHSLYSPDGKKLLVSESSSFTVDSPLLWDTAHPSLYTLTSQLIVNGVITDEESNSFGFRTLDFKPDEGFFLNGKHVKLNGVCNHSDLGALGSAFNCDAAERQLSLIKDMGANALRTSHNPPAPELLDMTDRMGILVVDEAFDMWEHPKTEFDYARFFKSCWRQDVKSWIERDRNHPSVIMWSIGNEIYDTHADAHGQELTQALADEVKKYDPDENAGITLGSNYMPWENAQKCADIVKLAGYNYGEKYYEAHHALHPDWIIYGSETSSMVSSRGVYHFPLSAPILSEDDLQCSALGNSATSWGAKSLEDCALAQRDAPYSMGQFIWSGFDYIGEPTPYHTKNSYFGQIDTAGFPKDSFYFWQSVWTDFKKKPMVHLLPYWDFNEGQHIDVRAFSNAPYVELFVNGESAGRQQLEHKSGRKLTGSWNLPYTRGCIKAIAYDENLNAVAQDERRSFGDAAGLRLEADRTTLPADGKSLTFITVWAVDAEQNPIENANCRVKLTVTGVGRLLGTDNGDSTDYDEYKSACRRLFSGKLLAIIGSSYQEGPTRVEVSSPGLESAVLQLESFRPEPPCLHKARFLYTVPAFENEISEIPVRKLELRAPQGTSFSPEMPELAVYVRILPENAAYGDFEWKITSPSGAEINCAEIHANSENPRSVRIKALGDADFILRCMCRNGRAHAEIISCLEFRAEGLGELHLNPYEFVSASLYIAASGDVTPGNEKGIATARDSRTSVTFSNLDFGGFGTDTVTMPIFELESAPTEISFFEGCSDAEEKLLGRFIYHKKSIWNVYQDETFTFSRRLKGISSFTVSLNHKVHIKGFTFKMLNMAFETLLAGEADEIYGDSFIKENDAVTGIGNNVSLVFRGLDFGEQGAKKLIICGRAGNGKNSVNLLFSGENGDTKQLAEFPQTEDYAKIEFPLEPVYGKQDLTFVFLPGSNFDFKWFRFET